MRNNKWKIKLKISGLDGDGKLNIKLQSTADESSTVQALLQATLQFSIEHNVNFEQEVSTAINSRGYRQ